MEGNGLEWKLIFLLLQNKFFLGDLNYRKRFQDFENVFTCLFLISILKLNLEKN
jgi:hypothetical protein